jgi:transcriptional regulator with XRE-family HTH domain
MLTAAQLRAARNLLNWSQDQLAKATGVSVPTIRRMESDAIGPGKSTHENVEAIRAALEKGGIDFIPEDGGGAGLRLRKKAKR